MEINTLPPISNSVQIERVKMHREFTMDALHLHDFHEIYFLLSGERRYLLGHNIYDVSPGNAVIIPKNELHRTSAVQGKGYERYVIYFYDDTIKELCDNIIGFDFESFLSLGCLEFDPETVAVICGYLEQMQGEQAKSDEFSLAYMRNILRNVIITMLRYGKQKNCEQRDDADKIQTVAKYIRENFSDVITLESMAKMAFMENTYFSKRFKALTGFGFNEYLSETRIRAAEQLLRYSSVSVSEISEKCGFSSSNYFGDAFKRHRGYSPREYRRMYKKQG